MVDDPDNDAAGGAPSIELLIGRRTLPAVAALVAVTLALATALLIHVTRRQDADALDLSRRLASTALEERRRELGRTVKDYAYWGDAYRHLHPRVDTAWAYDAANLGRNLQEELGYEVALVIAPGDRTAYAVARGDRTSLDGRALLGRGLDALVEQARAAPDGQSVPATGLLSVQGRPAVAAAAVVSPGDDPTASLVPGPPSVLVFADLLEPDSLRALGAGVFVDGLRVREGDGGDGPVLRLAMAEGGEPLALTWDAPTPGRRLLAWVLPWLAVAGAALAALTWCVLRHAWGAARLVEAARRALGASETRFRDVVEVSSDWVWETDAELRFVYLSDRFAQVTGHDRAAVLGRHLHRFLRPEDADEEGWTARWADPAARRALRDLLCRYEDAAGRPRSCRLAARPTFGPDGGFAGFRGTASDVTAEVEARARLRHLSLHDELTGLPNRVVLRERLERELEASRRGGAALTAVLCLDLDDFKAVNDTLGHAAGDALLREIAGRLRACVRQGDTLARQGGDEFAVLLAGVRDASEVEVLCRRLIERVAEPVSLDGGEAFVGLSVGAALAPTDGADAETLMRHADVALYAAKSDGRGTFRLFARDMNVRAQERRALGLDLRRALGNDELVLHFQPRFAAASLELSGFEALLRWRHPARGLVGPDRFVPLAEETHLIGPIGAWALGEACRLVAPHAGLSVSVNLSPAQFRRGDLVGDVERALDTAGLEPGRLELEITEGVLLENTAASLRVLHRLRQLGARLAMDDFGTGYSSLGYLQSFPFDRIKIDRRFVSRLGEGPEAEAIVRAVLGLGRALGIATAAEGVETADQLDFLRKEGCGELQGFLLGRPAPIAEFVPQIERGRARGPLRLVSGDGRR